MTEQYRDRLLILRAGLKGKIMENERIFGIRQALNMNRWLLASVVRIDWELQKDRASQVPR